jgi:hypothetical protein
MDYLKGKICWEEQGTFVYEVRVDSVTVITHPALEDFNETDIHFQKGNLVAVDLVRPTRNPSYGPYLRLSDGCGWLIETQDGETIMERVRTILFHIILLCVLYR